MKVLFITNPANFNPKQMKYLIALFLISCMRPMDKSGNYLVLAKRGHTVILKGINKRFSIPADKDTVKVGDSLKIIFITRK